MERVLMRKLSCLIVFSVLTLVFSPPAFAKDDGVAALRKSGRAFSAVAKKVTPAVVFIKVEKRTSRGGRSGRQSDRFGGFNDEFFRRFFGDQFRRREAPGKEYRAIGQGSGFIISKDGYILTNNHVVGDADRISVKLNDGREFEATLVGADSRADVAIIKVEAKGLPYLKFGDSDALEVGEWVLALGNPFGLTHTLTAGIVSAKGRSSVGIAEYEDFIQTDAAINPGNSGGPLINLDAEVVGMNTAIFSKNGGYMGIGFAIPINMAKNIYGQIKDHGSVIRGYLGVVIQDIDQELSRKFELKDNSGALVAEVGEDTPASRGGLRQGDVIVKLNGKKVKNVSSFRNKIAMIKPGHKVTITIVRKGREKQFSVTIGDQAKGARFAGVGGSDHNELGIQIQPLTSELAREFGLQGESGVLVTEVRKGSVADMAGIEKGTLIQEINRRKVVDLNSFNREMERASGAGSLLMLVKTEKYSRYIVLRKNK